MDNEEYFSGQCPIGRAAARAGDIWSLMILRDAGRGMTRFEQFRLSLGVAPNILTRRLRALTRDGLLEKRRYCERPPRDEYVLTQAGRDFLPILHALAGWSARHCGGGLPMSRVEDVETGLPIDPVVIDRHTGVPLGERPLRLVQPEK
ncbi:hypothetical protein M529_11285 [Sphingobium ummariense RL-3]|uniref:HTH hxlR-type domain-containing protein n=2 Tax=Sphingobium TaxID=165695 RepID=T0IT95_9SPHN|nr:hypothetical protein M529_11285 [Sphingobium ummariense RL-3]